MSFLLELKNSQRSMEIETELFLSFAETPVLALSQALDVLGEAVPLAHFETVRTEVNEYSYEIRAADGRLFRQTFLFAETPTPGMTFDVPQRWQLSEFALHRPLRDLIVTLIRDFGLIKLEVDYV